MATTFLEANHRAIWNVVSDPMRFVEIYPSWMATVEPSGDMEFWIAASKAGEYFNIYSSFDEPTGTADFELIDELGMSTFFRTRIMSLPTGGCVVVQLASRVPGGNDEDWEARATALPADLEKLAQHI